MMAMKISFFILCLLILGGHAYAEDIANVTEPSNYVDTDPSALVCKVWAEGFQYNRGDVVSYQGKSYICLQSHFAYKGAGWNPVATPALWQPGGNCSGPTPSPRPTPRPTPAPTPRPSPTPTPAPGQGSGQIVRGVYVTFYGFDDNDDGNGNYGNAVISDPVIHRIATEDLGTFDHPSTFATDKRVAQPGTLVYIPKLRKYYIMEDTCRECTADRNRGRIHIDPFMGGNTRLQGQPLINCEEALTADPFTDVVVFNPGNDWPVQTQPLFRNGVCNSRTFPVPFEFGNLLDWIME
ncbi:MAG: carbohydrate-binding protein [Bdellovibrionia bacterium]